MIGLRILTAIAMMRIARASAVLSHVLIDISGGMLDDAERRMDEGEVGGNDALMVVAVLALAIAVGANATRGWL